MAVVITVVVSLQFILLLGFKANNTDIIILKCTIDNIYWITVEKIHTEIR